MINKFILILYITIYIKYTKTSSEYVSYNTHNTNYLETYFNDTVSHIFPSDLKISLILTSTSNGLLFYSIDNNYNQLIVTIKVSIDYLMQIEFRGERIFISIKEHCNCKICLHEKLNFQFGIKYNSIDIKCHKNQIINFSFPQKKRLNENYPLPKFDTNDKISAYLWLINTPTYNNGYSIAYPNNGHLSGRFSDIMYKDIPLNLSIVGSSNKCNNMCTDDLCNGGQCLETFQCKPVCDCTETFLNGEFCNSTISSYEKQDNSISFQLLKLSWTGLEGKIFKISNKNITFGISFLSRTILQFTFKDNFTSKIEFPGNYSDKEKNILIIEYEFKSMKIRFTNGIKMWTDFQFFSYRNVLEENFTEIKLFGDPNGDIVYKRFASDWKLYSMKGLSLFESIENSSMKENPLKFKSIQNEPVHEMCISQEKVCNGIIATLEILNVITIGIVIYMVVGRKKIISKLRPFLNEKASYSLIEVTQNETPDKTAIVENDPNNFDYKDTGLVNKHILNSSIKNERLKIDIW